MLRIRLRRVGKKKAPAYRIVVADSRSPRDGKFIEVLGLYDPLTEPVTVNVDAEKVREWVGRGAQPSEPVERLMRNAGVLPAAAAGAETAPAASS
jgi:small subunit ribosomal protein S16